MTKKPLVSVIMPSFNHAMYIARSIESVLNQTYTNIELLISDDNSTDGTYEVVKKFLHDARIKAVKQAKNIGPVKNTNYLISQCNGSYISLLNSDDVFYLDKIEKQVKFLEENREFGAVFGFAHAIDEKGNDFSPNFEPFEPRDINRTRYEWLRTFFFKGNYFMHPTIMIRSQIYEEIGLYNHKLWQVADFERWIALLDKHEVYVMPEKLIRYRFRDNNMNASDGSRKDVANRVLFEYQIFIQKYFDIIDNNNLYKIFPDIRELESKLNISSLEPQTKFAIYIVENEDLSKLGGIASVYRLIAQNIIFDYFSNAQKGQKLVSLVGLDYIYKLSGKKMLFNCYPDEVDISESYIKKSVELDSIYSSVSWRVTTFLKVKLLDKVLKNRGRYWSIIKPVIKRIILYFVPLKNVLNKIIRNCKRIIYTRYYLESKLEPNQPLLTLIVDKTFPMSLCGTHMDCQLVLKSTINKDNHVLSLIKGKYIVFSDLKENLDDNLIEKLIYITENEAVDYLICTYQKDFSLTHQVKNGQTHVSEYVFIMRHTLIENGQMLLEIMNDMGNFISIPKLIIKNKNRYVITTI